MGALLGLLCGLGAFLVIGSVTAGRRQPRRRATTSVMQRVTDMLAQAGVENVTPLRLLAACLGTGALVGVVMLAISQSVVIAAAFAVLATSMPVTVVSRRRHRRRSELRDLWPEVVDNLSSAVRAGLSLPEGLAQLGLRGPEQLRRHFQRFGEDYRATGRFDECLNRLKDSMSDPVGDRIVESLRLAREVGGSDLGRLLRTLSSFLREDARVRAEIETRQGWTVNGARVAVASPWLVLALLSLNPSAVRAYNTSQGALVLAVGAAVCVAAYRLMLRIGRLPEEERVLR